MHNIEYKKCTNIHIVIFYHFYRIAEIHSKKMYFPFNTNYFPQFKHQRNCVIIYNIIIAQSGENVVNASKQKM